MISNLKLKEELVNVSTRFFINEQQQKFQKFLASLDDVSKHVIKNNKQLNEMYDLFLDFIIDSNNILDYIDSKEQLIEEKNDVGSD
jgi:hypothetical protein